MVSSPGLKNIFGDKSSIVIRALLREPDRHWTTRQLAEKGTSLGLVSLVLAELEKSGFIVRRSSGRFSYSVLTEPQKLLETWTHAYRFQNNPQAHFYTPDPELLPKLRDHFVSKKIPYALTAFSGVNLVAPYVVNNDISVYIDVPEDEAEQYFLDLQTHFTLVPPKAGANVHFVLPIYRTSVFRDSRPISGYQVVSNLQLYLDLVNHPLGGEEQAEWLATRLEEWKTPLFGKRGGNEKITKVPKFDTQPLSGSGLIAFKTVSDKWGLTDEQKRVLLGKPACSTYHHWMGNKDVALGADTLERISYVVGIFKALHFLFPAEAADGWIRRPNSDPLFGGRPAIEIMLHGQVADLLRVRDYLASQA